MQDPALDTATVDKNRPTEDFLQKILNRIAKLIDFIDESESVAQQKGLLQTLDPRIKLICVLLLIFAGLMGKSLSFLLLLCFLLCLLARRSGVALRHLWPVWRSVLLFTGIIALPALFLVPGQRVFSCLSVTHQGLQSASFLLLRAELASSLCLLLVLTTPWPSLLKALRVLGAPVVLIALLGMTQRYIFLLLQNASQMFEARRCRLLAPMPARLQRAMIIDAAGVLLARTLLLSEEVHQAMLARGYRGEMLLLSRFRTRPMDWLLLCLSLLVFGLAWISHAGL